MPKQREKFITLKEAAEISGYDPDYVGQLIRQGKLYGKQVYRSVAWMTTEEALREYIERKKNKNGDSAQASGFMDKLSQKKRRFWLEDGPSKVLRAGLYFAIGLLAGFVLLLFYVFSVNIESKLQERAMEKIIIEPTGE